MGTFKWNFGLIFRKYHLRIEQVLISPFETKNLPTFPLVIRVRGKVVATLECVVVVLPFYSAQEILEQGKVEIYAWLPTMDGATAERLRRAIQEMKAYYGEQKERLHSHLLWFATFLRRSTTVSAEDKKSVLDEMTGFDSLLDENDFVIRRKAEMLAKGRVEGLQRAVAAYIEVRFPPLAELAHQRVAQITRQEKLDLLLRKIYSAPDELAVREFLDLVA